MALRTNVFKSSVAGVLGEAVADTDGVVYVVSPTGETLEALLDVLSDAETTVNVLAAESVLKELSRDFKLASRAANLEETGQLSLRVGEPTNNTLVVTEDSVAAVVAGGTKSAGLAADDETFIADAYERYADAFDRANAFDLRTPGTTRVRQTLAESLGEQTADDFEAVIGSMETARGDDSDLSEVTVALLVAAKNEELLYDISKWGEDVGIASKATFSRTKSDLEESGLIDTEKVPIDVGRPRLRLKLGDDRLRNVSPGELASVAQSVLAK